MVTRFASYFGRAHAVFFVGNYFVVRLSTTKSTKISPPEKYPLYSKLLVAGAASVNKRSVRRFRAVAILLSLSVSIATFAAVKSPGGPGHVRLVPPCTVRHQ